MAMTSADVNNQSFSIDKKGYNVDEVDDFLERISADLDEYAERVVALQRQMEQVREKAANDAAPADGSISRKDIESRDKRIAELEKQVSEHKADDSAIAQALIIAQRSADEIITNAKAAADKTHEDAEDEAQRILDKANNEKQRVLGEISKLESDREATRGQYQDLLNNFISSAGDVLSGLEKGKRAGYVHSKTSSASAGVSSGGEAADSIVSAATAAYTTPSNPKKRIVAPAAVKPSTVEKDFSGFGDTDDGFEFDEID